MPRLGLPPCPSAGLHNAIRHAVHAQTTQPQAASCASRVAQAGLELRADTSRISDSDSNTKADNGDAGYTLHLPVGPGDAGVETDIAEVPSSTCLLTDQGDSNAENDDS